MIDGRGRPVTYPLIPLWDGEQIYLTSSALFSRKLEHIRANPRVSLSITDPVAVGGAAGRATIQGDARIIEEDPHGGWERLLPIWERKEPSIVYFLKARVALPLFFERALIEITPRRALYWADGDPSTAPMLDADRRGGGVMRSTPELDARTGMEKLATYPYLVATWVDEAGYPVSVAVVAEVDLASGLARFRAPAGLTLPATEDISLTGSHIRPQPGYGYDERRHVTVWGPALVTDGTVTFRGRSAWGWDEAEVPFFEYSERSVGKSRKYFDALSAERGTPVKPRLSFGFLTLRATRLPFLTATLIPVALGILIAARQGSFDLVAALLTIAGACLRAARAERGQRRVRHDAGRRRRQRHADAVQRRLAGHPIRARQLPPDGGAVDGVLRPGRPHRVAAPGDAGLRGAAARSAWSGSWSASATPPRR